MTKFTRRTRPITKQSQVIVQGSVIADGETRTSRNATLTLGKLWMVIADGETRTSRNGTNEAARFSGVIADGETRTSRNPNGSHVPRVPVIAEGGTTATGLTCSVCHSPDWIACRPGTDAAAARHRGNVIDLVPPPDVPAVAWCLDHWPFLNRSQAAP